VTSKQLSTAVWLPLASSHQDLELELVAGATQAEKLSRHRRRRQVRQEVDALALHAA
jgi:hypothetical protein